MLLVALMRELMLDVGPSSQRIEVTLPDYDTFAYVVTTFAVNGYEVKISESIDTQAWVKDIIGRIAEDGWSITLYVNGVPVPEGSAEAQTNDGKSALHADGLREEREGPVSGPFVRRRNRGRASTAKDAA